MFHILGVVLLFSFKKIAECDINVSDPLFRELPPLFQIDDDQECRQNRKLYCKISLKIHPTDWNNKSLHWKIIEDTISHPKFYNHDELFHALCITNFCTRNITDQTADIERKISECYGNKYKHLGLDFSINELRCEKDQWYTPGTVDLFVMFIAVIYFSTILLATYIDYRGKRTSKTNTNSNMQQTGPNKTIIAFSLISNWKRLRSISNRPDFQKLKFLQGIRFYNMLLIVFCHTICSYIGGYVANTEYFEQAHRNQIKQSIITLFMFLVQTFFLLSAFLLSYHICQTMKSHEDSKFKCISLAFLNRYLRIFPPVLVMILLSSTIWIFRLFKGPIKDIFLQKEYQRCQRNWWTNLLFMNNHYNETDMCYFLTWYLAADTQLYLVSLIILLIIWTFRKHTQVILAVAIIIGVAIPIIMCYRYGLDIVYRMTPENAKFDNYRSFQFNAMYTSTYANMGSYMVGLALGYIYYRLEKNNFYNRLHHVISMGLFTFLPGAVIYISSQDYAKTTTLFLSGLVKPLYALGIGAGIIAMSQQKSGIIKKICELKPVVFLGNFTYSTYVVQYVIVFYRTACAKEPLFLSDYVMVTSFIQDAILSILCGFLMHILVEMPANQLQKMYIPQIRDIVSSKHSKHCTQHDKLK